jgi:hypothetical protein
MAFRVCIRDLPPHRHLLFILFNFWFCLSFLFFLSIFLWLFPFKYESRIEFPFESLHYCISSVRMGCHVLAKKGGFLLEV